MNPRVRPSPAWEEFRRRQTQAAVIDRRRIHLAVGVALVAHLLLLALRFPEARILPTVERQRPPLVLRPSKWIEPTPQPEAPTPQQEARVTVPVPGWDEGPLPMVVDLPEVLPAMDTPSVDWIEIPSGPPPAALPVDVPVLFDPTTIERPIKVAGPNPRYPELARRARREGVVVLQAVIDADGHVGDVQLLRDLPMGLGQAAVAAVQQWRFEPATRAGEPIAVVYQLTVRFQLQ